MVFEALVVFSTITNLTRRNTANENYFVVIRVPFDDCIHNV